MKLDQKGQATALVAILIIAGILFTGVTLLTQSQAGKKGAGDSDNAYSVMAKKLEWLANANWSDPSLTVGDHTEGDLKWKITDEAAVNGIVRTKKIALNYKLPTRSRSLATDQTLGLIGYKYHDF